jgi:hypothetical protein
MLERPVEHRRELRDDRVADVIVRQAYCRDARGGEDREVLPSVPQEPLLETMGAPPVELDDQPLLGEVRIDAISRDMDVDLQGSATRVCAAAAESGLQVESGSARAGRAPDAV